MLIYFSFSPLLSDFPPKPSLSPTHINDENVYNIVLFSDMATLLCHRIDTASL